MAEFKKLTKEEVAKLDKKDIYVAKKAAPGEVEGQGITRCPLCGTLLHVPGTPPYVTCCECGITFHVTWY